MSSHTDIQSQCYEYLRGDLAEDAARQVALHLETCAVCRAECEALRGIMEALPAQTPSPAESLPPEFWTSVLAHVDERIARPERRPSFFARFDRRLLSLGAPRRRLALGIASFALLALSTTITWMVLRQEPPVDPLAQAPRDTTSAHVAASSTDARVQQFLQKGRILLVGVANLPLEQEDLPTDLSLERRTSRELVAESRYLKQRVRDEDAARLIGDMEKIFVGLANAEDDVLLSNIVLVKDGIRRENLLFKVRIAETVYNQVRHDTHE